MGFFSRNQPEAKKEDSISTAAWQSIASGNSSNLDDNNRNDGNGFVNPEGPMALAPSSAWEKERYSQQMELEDGYRRKKRGRCSACIGWIIKVLHGVDVCLGISLIVYGSLIRTQFEPPAMAAAIFCLLLGTILFVSSAVGIFSYASRSCSRWGLLVSGFVAPYLSVVYITIIISLVVDSSGFFQYLEDHHDVMYFSENVVQNLEGLMGLVYSILGTLTALELTRTFVTLDTRKALISESSYEALIPQGNTASSLNAPLLEDKSYAPSESGGSHKKEVAETPEWWSG